MSGLCGWFDAAANASADTPAIESMAAELTRFDSSIARSATTRHGAVASAANLGDAHVHHDDKLLVAAWGHAHFTDEHLAAIQRRHGIGHALAEGYAHKHSDVFGALSGSFAVAILDAANGEAVLAIDRMGVRPLYYTMADGKLVFGSTLESILAFPRMAVEVDRQAIYDYVHFHMVPAPRTIYVGHYRLLPGTCLLWRKGNTEARPYWQMEVVEHENRPFSELKQTFLELLRESVREAAGKGAVGTFLSGGTDSSTVAGMLGEVTGKPARTYSIGFEAEGYDEMEYARIAARHFGTRHHEYYITPADVVAAIPAIAGAHDQPFGNSSAVPTYYCAKLAKEDGVERLLGGDGGDELFGGNARYATQYLYSLYSDLPRVLRKGLIEPILRPLPAGVAIIGKMQRYVRNASQPMPARYDNYNLLERLGPEMVFTPEFLETVDRHAPGAQMAEAYETAQARSLINRMLALDLKYTLADNDLPKVARSCELAGVEVEFPLLNDALVAFSARLAPRLKLKGTRLRYFFKKALRGFLPEEIIVKTKHGFGLPFGPWLRRHEPLRQIALDSLADLKQRRIVRTQLIDELTSKHVETHAEYYGTMIWVLMMLEQWFKRHRIAV